MIIQKKYSRRKTWLENRVLPSKLLFVTTSSAFGKSSMYERIKFYDEHVGKFIGYTAGADTFFISDKLYLELLDYLSRLGYDATRGYGTGPSRKLQFITIALTKIGIKSKSFSWYSDKHKFVSYFQDILFWLFVFT